MEILDLHGIKHEDVKALVDSFININFNNLPIEIITGNSVHMLKIVRKIVQSHELNMEPTNYINLGSYIISHK